MNYFACCIQPVQYIERLKLYNWIWIIKFNCWYSTCSIYWTIETLQLNLNYQVQLLVFNRSIIYFSTELNWKMNRLKGIHWIFDTTIDIRYSTKSKGSMNSLKLWYNDRNCDQSNLCRITKGDQSNWSSNEYGIICWIE